MENAGRIPWNIFLLLWQTSQDSIHLVRKFYLDCSLDALCTRGGIRKGDILVANIEELETMEASEMNSGTLKAKGGDISQRKWKIHTPSRRWTNRNSWRRSGTENIHLDTAAINSRRKSRWFSWRIRRVSSTTSRLVSDASEAINDFWSMARNSIYRHHFEPRVKLYSPREESFPVPLKYIDVSRTTRTNLDVKTRKPHRWLLEYRWVKRLAWSLDRFHTIYSIGRKTSKGFMWSGWRLTRKQLTSRPDHLRPEIWKTMGKNAKLKEKQKWSNEKLHLDNARVLPYLCERPVKNPSIWKESLSWIVPWIRYVRGWNLEGWHIGCRHWGIGKFNRVRNPSSKIPLQRIFKRRKMVHISASQTKMEQWSCLEEIRFLKIHLKAGATCKRRRAQWWSSRRVGRVSADWQWCMTEKPETIFGRSQGITFIAVTLNQEFSSTCRRKNHSEYNCDTFTWSGEHTTHELGCVARKLDRWLSEHYGRLSRSSQ